MNSKNIFKIPIMFHIIIVFMKVQKCITMYKAFKFKNAVYYDNLLNKSNYVIHIFYNFSFDIKSH